MEYIFELNERGHLKKRESFDVEFKANFHLGNQLLDYIRSLVGMANNKGGQIIFGVTDKPRKPLGMTNDKFITCDPSKINQALLEYFSPEIEWEMDVFKFQDLDFGRLTVKEASQKPVMCKKNSERIFREGAIYYRYRGETKEIQFSELSTMLQKERDKEKHLWMKHIQRIGAVGPQNIHLIDTFNGEIPTENGRILLDKNLLSRLKFIKEGQFVEKDGAPALKLVGEVTGLVDREVMPHFEKVYPYLAVDLQKKLDINNYQLQLLLKKFNIKGNSKYHSEVKIGRSSKTHKYTEELYSKLQNVLRRDPKIFDKIRAELKDNSSVKNGS